MKKLRQQLRIGILLIAALFASLMGYSQAGTGLTITVQNVIQTSTSTFTYDVFLTNTGTTSLALRGYSCGINHAVGLNAGTGTITHTFVSRDAALSTLPAVAATYTAASNHMRLTTTNATAGNEVALAAGIPLRIATMQVTNTVPFTADFNPNLQLQLVTAPGKTQCIATVIITPPGTSFTVNGTANTGSATNLNILNGVMNAPCFYLNPTGVFTATKTAETPVVCFGASTGTAQVTFTSTGSAAPYGTAGNYKIDGGSDIPYTGNPITVSGLSAGTHTITITTSATCIDTAEVTILGPSAALTSSFSATACGASYTLPWGTTISSTGAYTNTYLASNGCDSIVTGNITFNTPSINAPITATSCDSYTWSVNSTTYTTSGSYTASFTNAIGCDSSIVLNLTINNSSNSTTTISSAGPYTWAVNSTTYSASGTYTATFLNAAGCDSNSTLILTITGAAFTLTIQEDLPISCFGNNDAAALATAVGSGSYTYSIDGGTFTNTTGYFGNLTPGIHTICAFDGAATVCDTISFIEPGPLAINFVIDSTVSCLGNDGQITAVVTGGTNLAQGYLTLWTNSNIPPDTLNNQLTNNFDLTVSGLPVGTYNLYIEDDHGCFLNSSTTLGLTPPVVVTASNTSIVCNGGTSVISASAAGGTGNKILTIGGSPIASSYPAGTYTITATDAKGCTGTTELIITQPNALGGLTTASACNSYVWAVNGLTYTASGVYSTSFTTSSGCDSVFTLNLTINSSTNNAVTSATACNSYTWTVNGTTYTTSGSYTASFLNAAGCDSSKVLNLTISTNTTTSTNVTANNLYIWAVNGQTYTTSGVYTYTQLTSSGCVHTEILNLTINVVSFALNLVMDQPISCFGNDDGSILATATGVGPFVYILDGGTVVNSTGFFTNLTPGMHTVCALEGTSILCDSMLFVEPAPLAATFTVDSVVSCLGGDGMLSINITGGTNVLQGYLTWWTNAAGDTLNDVLNDNFALYVDSLGVGVYNVVVEDDHGCFFNATGTMVAAPPIVVNATIPPIICFGATTTITPIGTGGVPYAPLTYSINGNPVAASYGPGTYTITATDAKGCTGTTEVTITAPTVPITNAVSTTACNSYTWVGTSTTYTASGVYTATLLAANGCDSTVTLTLTINNSTINAPVSATACNSYLWSANGTTYTASGAYTATFLNAVGCDSSHVLNLTINNSTINSPTTISSCNTYNWSANGTTYTASGSYTATFLNAAGCDSNHTLNLTINTPSINTPTSATACNSYTWSANGTTFTTSGTYTATFLNAAGCDSSVTLNLTINQSSVNTPTIATSCNTYLWTANGTTYTASGTYNASFTNAAGCDSSVVLNLTINLGTVNPPTSITACNSYTWVANGVTYTTSGSYTSTYLNAAGCLSVNFLTLTINTSTISPSVTTAACTSYTWTTTGATYTTSGNYVNTYLNAAGCLSSDTLHLTINALPTVTATATPPTTCSYSTITLNGGGAVSYTWNPTATDGVPFTIINTTTYTVTGVDANGCSNTASVTVTTTGSSSDIVNTTTGNATSVAGTECQTLLQVDASTITYHDVNCKAIVTIQDATGGNVLGNVVSCAVVSASVPVYNTQPYLPRHYTISADSPGPSIVTFYFTQDDFNDYNAAAGAFPQIPVPVSPLNGDVTTLCISQVPQTSLPGAPGALTTVIPVTAVWNAAAARWEITTPVSGFGGFYFHACNPNNVPLPATITKFTGHKAVTKDVLEWTTSSEQNNAYFNLQHGTDGVNFTTLAKVDSKAPGGNSNVNIDYTAENLKPSIGHNYYRLMQVDLDGHTSYESQIVDLIWNADGSHVTIYPNPTSDVLNIDLYTVKEVNTVVKVMDMSGRTVKQVLVRTNAGLNTMNISMSEMANGIYTVQILENDKLTFVEKVRKND